MSNFYRIVAVFAFLLLMKSVSAKNVVAHFDHMVVPVAVAEHITIEVELYLPTRRDPRALVIVSPNSGGLSDPCFDQELAEPQYIPERRGGLTAALIEAGYAVAFYSQRGFALLGSCVSGDNFQARAASFANACISSAVRARVALSTITHDTQAIFNALQENSKTTRLPIVALPYSEGMHHVSSLAGKGLIKLVRIVSVGVPRSSLADVWQYQMQDDHDFRIIEKAFASCSRRVLSIEQIFACANVTPTPDGHSKMRAFLNSEIATQEALAMRRKMRLQLYGRALAHYAASDASETMEGEFGGNKIPVAFSAHYYKEVFESRISIVDQLGRFNSRTRFLFGEFDHLFPELDELAAKNSHESVSITPDTIIIRGVGHGLEDLGGFAPARALAAIVHAVDEVLRN